MSGMSQSLFNTAPTLYSMLRHPYVSREQLVGFQNKYLRRVIDHAYRHVPYYRELFDRNGLKPYEIQTIQDLQAVPITSRSALQALAAEELITRKVNPRELISRSSSGSSGRPFVVRRTWLEERIHGAFRFRALRSVGFRAREKICYVIGLRSPQRQDHQFVQRLLAAFGIGRQKVVNGLQAPEDILKALQKIRPTVVSGYPGVLARIAHTVEREKLRSLRLRFVNTGGEVLTSHMRHHIQTGFCAPVFDSYGSIEFNLLAWECRSTGEYHSCDDGMITEVLHDGIPVAEGESGEVVGTDLHSFAMPLIRYKLDDVVTKGREVCRCGQPFSTIRSIQGRILDYFRLTDGRLIHPYDFPLGHEKFPWIREFQIIQQGVDRIVMKIAPFHKPSSDGLRALIEPMKKLLGQDVTFEIELVSDIPREASGKFRVYRSFAHPGQEN